MTEQSAVRGLESAAEGDALNWSARFKQPIAVPSRQPIETLGDARSYVLALGDQIRGTRTWEIALLNLLRAAEEGGAFVELARMMLAQAIANPDAVIDKPPRRRSRKIHTKCV